jgi:hypothetical protein
MSRSAFLAGGAAAAAAFGLPGHGWAATAVPRPPRAPAIVRSFGGLVVPGSGCYWGADDTTRGFTGATGIETQLGRRMAIRNRRYDWLVACPNAAHKSDARLIDPAVIPMVSMTGLGAFPVKSPGWGARGDLRVTSYGQGIDRIANGEFDGYWTQVALGLKALGTPVIFRLFMEMNGLHNPFCADWQGGVGLGGELSFANAWRRVRSVFAGSGATIDVGGNCIFVFCAQRMSTSGSWKAYWPGDDQVDWSGVDLYRTTFEAGAKLAVGDMDTYTWAVTHGKPYIVCESGFDQATVVSTSAGRFDKDGHVTGESLIQNHHAAVSQNPQLVAYLSWNNIGPLTDDFVDTSARSLAQYRAFANDPYCGLVRS